MEDAALVDELRRVRLFEGLPDEQLRWIAEHGTEVRLTAGEKIASQGDPADGFYAVLKGETEWTRRVGPEEVHAVTLGEGEVFAELILLLEAPYPTTGYALTDVRLYRLGVEAFWEMLDVSAQLRRGVLKVATERSQIHESVSNQQAKLISLGNMAAGLAHELNNPAAASRRAADELGGELRNLRALALDLGEHRLSAEQRDLLVSVLDDAAASSGSSPDGIDPLSRSDREDELADRLDALGMEDAWELSPLLVEAGLDAERIEGVVGRLDPEAVPGALAWLGATLAAEASAASVRRGTARISELVGAMREYTYLDQAPLQEVDIHQGLESTLTILRHKLKRGVEVIREYDHTLPRISARGGELNQVWTNLIDNAADAMDGRGRLTLRTRRDGDRVLVEIADDGPGIPEEVKDHIFEPYFTTKGVGEGTGIGLDIVRRIVVGAHKGDIRVESEPGDTRFQVRLPATSGGETTP